jgi:hypothetical protein
VFAPLLRRRSQLVVCVLILTSCLAVPALGDGVPREECFPVERLDPAARARAEELLLKALDCEALYTIVGGLKPFSGSFGSARVTIKAPDVAKLDETRRALSAFRCGDSYEAGVLVFAAPLGEQRIGHAWVSNRPSVARMLASHQAFFGSYGISPSSSPTEMMTAMEHAPRADRFRANGYFYGYPDHAVDFFVESDARSQASADKDKDKKKTEPRDFISIPTFTAATNKFVWAVPKGHQPNDADLALKAQAEPIYAEYRLRREYYIGEGKPGVVALLRDWFDDGYGRCAPENARFDGTSHVPWPVPAAAPALVVEAAPQPAPAPVVYPYVQAQPTPAYVPQAGFFQRRRQGYRIAQ